jgi:hypothetical protein
MTNMIRTPLNIPINEKKKMLLQAQNNLPVNFKVNLREKPNELLMLTPTQARKLQRISGSGKQKTMGMKMSKTQLKKNIRQHNIDGEGLFADIGKFFTGVAADVAKSAGLSEGMVDVLQKTANKGVDWLEDKIVKKKKGKGNTFDKSMVKKNTPYGRVGPMRPKLLNVPVHVPKQQLKRKLPMKLKLNLQKKPNQVLGLKQKQVDQLRLMKGRGMDEAELFMNEGQIYDNMEQQQIDGEGIFADLGKMLTGVAATVAKSYGAPPKVVDVINKQADKGVDWLEKKLMKGKGIDIISDPRFNKIIKKKMVQQYRGGALDENDKAYIDNVINASVTGINESVTNLQANFKKMLDAMQETFEKAIEEDLTTKVLDILDKTDPLKSIRKIVDAHEKILEDDLPGLVLPLQKSIDLLLKGQEINKKGIADNKKGIDDLDEEVLFAGEERGKLKKGYEEYFDKGTKTIKTSNDKIEKEAKKLREDMQRMQNQVNSVTQQLLLQKAQAKKKTPILKLKAKQPGEKMLKKLTKKEMEKALFPRE